MKEEDESPWELITHIFPATTFPTISCFSWRDGRQKQRSREWKSGRKMWVDKRSSQGLCFLLLLSVSSYVFFNVPLEETERRRRKRWVPERQSLRPTNKKDRHAIPKWRAERRIAWSFLWVGLIVFPSGTHPSLWSETHVFPSTSLILFPLERWGREDVLVSTKGRKDEGGLQRPGKGLRAGLSSVSRILGYSWIDASRRTDAHNPARGLFPWAQAQPMVGVFFSCLLFPHSDDKGKCESGEREDN